MSRHNSFMHSNNCYDCYSCPCPCPPRPRVCCGTTYYPWTDCYGNCFKSKLTSAVDETLLNGTLMTLAVKISSDYNSGIINILSYGILDSKSTLVDVTTATTYVTDISIAAFLTTVLTSLKSLYPASVMTVSITSQILTNELVNLTYVLTISSAPVTVITMVTLNKAIECGAKPPVVVSGTVTGIPLD